MQRHTGEIIKQDIPDKLFENPETKHTGQFPGAPLNVE
jgi:hypothetical protein